MISSRVTHVPSFVHAKCPCYRVRFLPKPCYLWIPALYFGAGVTRATNRKKSKTVSIRKVPQEWTPEIKEAFLQILSMCGNVTTSAELIGGCREYAYVLRGKDKEFSEAWDAARRTAVDRLEQEAWSRAVKGVKKPVGFYMGEHGGTFVQEKSDNLLMFCLKGERPEKYRDNVHHSGDATGGLAEQLARALARRDGPPVPLLPAPEGGGDDDHG